MTALAAAIAPTIWNKIFKEHKFGITQTPAKRAFASGEIFRVFGTP
jgi:hypothetical protein